MPYIKDDFWQDCFINHTININTLNMNFLNDLKDKAYNVCDYNFFSIKICLSFEKRNYMRIHINSSKNIITHLFYFTNINGMEIDDDYNKYCYINFDEHNLETFKKDYIHDNLDLTTWLCGDEKDGANLEIHLNNSKYLTMNAY